MGVFVNWLSSPFSAITDTETTILTAPTHTLLVGAVTVCNTGEKDILFNLKKTRTTPSQTTYISYNLPIKSYKTIKTPEEKNTLEIVSFLGVKILLEVGDSLVCFTNGYTQFCDCEIMYISLNELPPTV
jgi:hypothetical protein